ncbi:hormogonium polysaccharide biosynthesis glycosyltransferase HpsP [Almyronema epifaneia]|uniref:Hormogonium polysaccharide biosynthesis glycosyltransferase HpsP n=1 Tax=Almyronema epifaneia S1 TaxID=2991925 RepID=A0ABW6IFN4_9CYAN
MRVLQIVPSISLVYGGPSQMVRGLSAALTGVGAEVTVLTTDSNGDVDEPPLAVPLQVPVQEDGYTVWYFRCSPFRRYKFSLGLLRWLAQHAQTYDIAHIHALFSPLSSAAATVARQQGLPYLLRPLGTLDPADLRKKRHLKRIYVAMLEKANLAGAAALHFTSEQEAKVSERFGTTTPGLILPLGVAAPAAVGLSQAEIRDRYQIPAATPILLYMSRIDPKKGLDLLLPALETLAQSGVAFHFILSGANPQDRHYEQQIQQRIQTSALKSQTTLTGFVTGELKSALLAAADCFVLPSYYENFGIAVAEAMIAGKPVVISDQVHIWHAIAESQSGWVVPCQQTALTAALQQALEDDQQRQQRGQNAYQYAQTHYSWPAIAQQTIAAYRQLLASQPQRLK